MHILDFLKSATEGVERGNDDSIRVEYRLVCSGTLFPDNFMGDWSRSDVARILLCHPVELLVASRPYDNYPQELVVPTFRIPLHRIDIFGLIFQQFRQGNCQVVEK
jgi:hypothetical protein